jgi:hypothetical protein
LKIVVRKPGGVASGLFFGMKVIEELRIKTTEFTELHGFVV